MEQKQCPNCRAELDIDWMYCPWCGNYARIPDEEGVGND